MVRDNPMILSVTGLVVYKKGGSGPQTPSNEKVLYCFIHFYQSKSLYFFNTCLFQPTVVL
jgi:hypothetical protein